MRRILPGGYWKSGKTLQRSSRSCPVPMRGAQRPAVRAARCRALGPAAFLTAARPGGTRRPRGRLPLRAGPAGAFSSGSSLAGEMRWRCTEALFALKERSQPCSGRTGPGSVRWRGAAAAGPSRWG